jgi:hypothetical protein
VFPVPPTDAFYQWRGRVNGLFPKLPAAHQRLLADYAFGMFMARCCGLTSVVLYLAGFLGVAIHALRQRLRELYQPAKVKSGTGRSVFDHTSCFGPLVRWAAGTHPDKRLVLALDPSNLTDRFRVLCAAVLFQGVGLPVAWAVQAADEKGSWNDIWLDLLGRLKEALGDGWAVLVLTDRGLESQALFRAIAGLGWHPLMRAKKAAKFRPASWRKGMPLDYFASGVGRRWAGRGTAYPTGERLECALLAVWEAGHEEAWFVLTDLPPASANPAWYAWRMWIEQGFRAIKRGLWDWHKTRMRDPLRVARLWAALALATLYAVEVGSEGRPAGVPPLREAPEKFSALGAGLLRIFLALVDRRPLPEGEFVPHHWPERTWQPDDLAEPPAQTS